MIKILCTLLLVIIITSCENKNVNSNPYSEYFENGNIKSKTYSIESGDSIINYFRNRKDTISSIITYSNDSLARKINFYPDEKIKSIGDLFADTLKTGIWQYYHSKGYIEDSREYYIIDNTSYLNQRWVLNSKGDTIRGNFFEIKFNDTILLGEKNRFHFFLKEPLLSNDSEAFVILPKKGQQLKKDFSNQKEILWDTIFDIGLKNSENVNLKDRRRDVIFDVFTVDSGENELVGIFIEKNTNNNNTSDFTTRNIYFNIPYFVRPKTSD